MDFRVGQRKKGGPTNWPTLLPRPLQIDCFGGDDNVCGDIDDNDDDNHRRGEGEVVGGAGDAAGGGGRAVAN